MQAVLAGRLIAQLASGLSNQFAHVILHGIGGSNHSRLTRKYQFKGGTLNSFDWVAYEYAAAVLARHENVRVNIYPSKKHVIDLAGWKFLCAHGDHIKAWMGIPYYGIARELGREALRRLEKIMEQLRRDLPVTEGFDYGLGAHWHVPFAGPSFKYIINGCLTGTTELDHTQGRHAVPQQVGALVSHKHGMFGPIAWRLDSPEEAELVGRDVRDEILTERDPAHVT